MQTLCEVREHTDRVRANCFCGRGTSYFLVFKGEAGSWPHCIKCQHAVSREIQYEVLIGPVIDLFLRRCIDRQSWLMKWKESGQPMGCIERGVKTNVPHKTFTIDRMEFVCVDDKEAIATGEAIKSASALMNLQEDESVAGFYCDTCLRPMKRGETCDRCAVIRRRDEQINKDVLACSRDGIKVEVCGVWPQRISASCETSRMALVLEVDASNDPADHPHQARALVMELDRYRANLRQAGAPI